MGRQMRKTKHSGTMGLLSIILIGFAVLCLVTAFILNHVGQKELLSTRVAGQETTLGPIRIPQDDTVLEVEVRQSLPTDSWNFLTFALLDEHKRYLTGFGQELWDEDGRDSDGYWHESENSFDAKVTVPDDGIYYLAIKPESSLPPARLAQQAVFVKVTAQAFSPIPHLAAGVITLILGVMLNFSAGGFLARALRER